jgi:hypothetical protein
MSALFWIRSFAYLILPLLLAGITIAVDTRANTRKRRLEVFMTFVFAFGAASGIAGALGHFFASDMVAQAVGWPAGSPFQLEMGFANLALGVLAAIAVGRRDGFRDATVIAVTILGVGAFIVHLIDFVQTGNLSPGNTLINITNLGRPALLIFFLRRLRKAERTPSSASSEEAFIRWQRAQASLSGASGAGVGVGLGTGMVVNLPLLGLALGLVGGLVLGVTQARQSPAAGGQGDPSPIGD